MSRTAQKPNVVQRLLDLPGAFPDPQAPRETSKQLEAAPFWTLYILLGVGVSMSVGGAIWGFFVWQDNDWWVPWIFVVVLEVVGLGVLAAFLHQLLARRKVADPEVFISVQPVYLGETFTVRLRQRFKGRCQLNSVTLKLLCREEATYRRGTSTYTDRHDVFDQVHTVAQARQVQAGDVLEEELSLTIPEDAMHTFAGTWNKILWYLHIHVDVASWPDYREDFHFHVAPRRAEQVA